MMDELYAKRLPVVVKCQDKEDRKTSVHLKMELQTVTNPLTKKELLVRLTDDKDLFFLYTLCLGEEDFQSLKVQQGLLVDFASFPQKFMDLLNMCLQEEHRDTPKFVLHFTMNSFGSGERSMALLNVVETNPFKHLIHLSLKFAPGSDSDIKKYLADCLKQLKDTNSLLQQKLEHTSADLSQRLREREEALSSKTMELESLKSEWTARISETKARHKEELTAEREKALQTQGSFQQRQERDRRELEQAHTKIVKQMEGRLFELEAANKELTDKKYKSESLIRELKSKLSVLEDETSHAKQDIASLRKHNTSLDSESHEKEKVISQLQTRVAVLEQEVKDKEQVVTRSADLLHSQQDTKRKVEEDLEKRGKEVTKLETKVKAMGEELKKGNEIIKKLQAEIKKYHNKAKLSTQIATEQERLLGEKDKELESLRQDLVSAKDSLKHTTEENKSLAEKLETTTQKLEESRKLLKTNENVIQWLNKQINEQQLISQRLGPFELPPSTTTATSIRPTSGAVHNFSASSYGSTTSRGEGPVRNGLPPAVGVPQAYPPPHRPPQVQYHPSQGNARRSALPVPSSGRSGPPPSIPEETRTQSRQQGSPSSNHSADKENDPPLDPKYFQKREDAIAVRGLLNRSNSPPVSSAAAPPPPSHHHHHHPPLSSQAPTSHHPSAASLGGGGGGGVGQGSAVPSVRLSQQMIVPRTSQPPLVSAYFPGQS
ncbi:spindle assembly abnormal protein 6 homolog [Babylonia areolata]|uniref:spindle assembly abnormal protein 6 homolog n=1 Tax=Babylonia areolata TaxID=304850 RepID=UPI003FD40E3C